MNNLNKCTLNRSNN